VSSPHAASGNSSMSIRVIRGGFASSIEPSFRPAPPVPCEDDSANRTHTPPAPPAPELTDDTLERACAESFEQGRLASSREFEEKLAALEEKVGQAICILSRERPSLRRAAEADVVKLALAIARRVIRRELSVDSDAIHGIVRVAIEAINNRDVIRVRVHAGLAPSVQRKLRDANLSHVEVVTDPGFDAGDIVFETQNGELDCSIEAQLKEIDLGIADRLGR
jgi:flagellar assembly protein FliH